MAALIADKFPAGVPCRVNQGNDMRETYELYDYYNAPVGRSATAEELEALRVEILAEPDTDEMPMMAEVYAPGAPCSFDLTGAGRLVPIINMHHALAWRARQADLAKG